MKKIFGLTVIGAAALSLASCGDDNTLVIWTSNDGLTKVYEGETQSRADEFRGILNATEGFEDTKVSVVQMPEDEMQTKLASAMRSNTAPDIILSGIQAIEDYAEEGLLMDMGQLMKDDERVDYDFMKEDFVDYIWEGGTYNGVLYGLSEQVSVGTYYVNSTLFRPAFADMYANSEAKIVRDGTTISSINELTTTELSGWASSQVFATGEQIVNASKMVADMGPSSYTYWQKPENGGAATQKTTNNVYQSLLFSADDMREYSFASTNVPWTVDGKLNPNKVEERVEFLTYWEQIYNPKLSSTRPVDALNTLAAEAYPWQGGWFNGFGGVPTEVLTGEAESATGNYTLGMAFSYPTWSMGMLTSAQPLDVNGDYLNEWFLASGPSSYIAGGSYLVIPKSSEMVDAAFEFCYYSLFDDERFEARARSQQETYSRWSIMNKIMAEDEGHALFGGQKTLEFFMNEAENISIDNVVPEMYALEELFRTETENYRSANGSKDIADILTKFYKKVQFQYPNAWPSDTTALDNIVAGLSTRKA